MAGETLTNALPLLTESFLVSVLCLFIEGVWKTVLEARHPKREELIGKLEARQRSRIRCDSASPRWLGQEWGAQNIARSGLVMSNSRAGSQGIWIIEVTNAILYR